MEFTNKYIFIYKVPIIIHTGNILRASPPQINEAGHTWVHRD